MFEKALSNISEIHEDDNRNELSISLSKSFENSFTLAEHMLSQKQDAEIAIGSKNNNTKQGFKVPALNLDKIKNQQNEFFTKNIPTNIQIDQND
jgi:hypothetical protein